MTTNLTFYIASSNMPPKTKLIYRYLTTLMFGHTDLNGNLFHTRKRFIPDNIKQALIRQTYEAPEIALAKKYIRPNDRVLEIGTGIGATTLSLSDIVGSKNVTAYEADPRNFSITQINTKLNRKQPKILNAAIVPDNETNEHVYFHLNSNISSSSIFKRTNTQNTIKVNAIPLAQAIALTSPNVLIMDIEGAECDVLMHSTALHTLRLIIMETHEHVTGSDKIKRMMQNLQSSNFDVVEQIQDLRFVVLSNRTQTASNCSTR